MWSVQQGEEHYFKVPYTTAYGPKGRSFSDDITGLRGDTFVEARHAAGVVSLRFKSFRSTLILSLRNPNESTQLMGFLEFPQFFYPASSQKLKHN